MAFKNWSKQNEIVFKGESIVDNNTLVQSLKNSGILKSKKIEQALLKVPRIDFVVPSNIEYAFWDIALPTISHQTISQPSTVVFMLEELNLKEGQRVLEIGFGSGWVTALMAEIVGLRGSIDALEILPDVYEFGAKNLAKYKPQNVNLFNESIYEFLTRNKKKYDRIISCAAFEAVPRKTKEILSEGGILITPMQNNSILKIEKNLKSFKETRFHGFVFVPIVKK